MYIHTSACSMHGWMHVRMDGRMEAWRQYAFVGQKWIMVSRWKVDGHLGMCWISGPNWCSLEMAAISKLS